MTEQRFPNDELLVSPDWLAEHLDDSDLRLVEVTPPGAGYPIGHIRGAVFYDPIRALEGGAVRVEEIAAELGERGIVPGKRIVIYDEIGGNRASQMFWLLEFLGFERVAVLEGGVERWLAEGHKQTRVKPDIEPSSFAPKVHSERLATADWIAARLENRQLVLVDCRNREEFDEGHIPGARLRPWDKTLTLHAYQGFRAAPELNREFSDLGATNGAEVVTYCGSGKRSSHTYFTLRLLGYRSVRNYQGSWDEWDARPDLPKEK